MNTRVLAGVSALLLGGWFAGRAIRVARYTLRDKVVLISGGSRGLGLVLARHICEQHGKVALIARDREELARAKSDLASRRGKVVTIECDLLDRAQIHSAVRTAIDRLGKIDILINNAGIIEVGPLDHMTREDFDRAMRLHFWAPYELISQIVPEMRLWGGGRIVNISSIGGKIGVPHLAPYCASKFALTGLSDSVRGELAKDNILVTTVCPGLMRTGSPFNGWFKGRHRDEFTWFAISDSLPLATIDGTRAARQIIDACRYGDAELVITWPAKLAVIANAGFPEAVALGTSPGNSLLPGPTNESGDQARSGWQSLSDWAPSKLTTLTDRAAAENNELPH